MGCTGELRRGLRALRFIHEVDGQMAGAVELARLAAGQRNDLDAAGALEMPQGGVADQPRRARDHNLLACHYVLPELSPVSPSRQGTARQSAALEPPPGAGAVLTTTLVQDIASMRLFAPALPFLCS